VLERDGVGGLGVALATITAVSDFELLGGPGRWTLFDEDGSSETIASSLEFRLVGQKMSEADLDGARRVGACVSTAGSLEECDELERVGIGGSGTSSGSFVIFVPQIDVSDRDRTGRSGAPDATTSDASCSSFFLKVHQEPAFCTLIVSVWVFSMPPINLCQSKNDIVNGVENTNIPYSAWPP
jgi:hypothetical protein